MSTQISQQTANILVIDDEPDICRLLADGLGGEELAVRSATSAEEAAAAVREQTPELIVIDLLLGPVRGDELLGEIREEFGDIPAVVITGCRDAEALARASRLRPVRIFTKPLDLRDLSSAIRGEIARRRSDPPRGARAVGGASEPPAAEQSLEEACTDLTATCHTLKQQMDRQELLIRYQNELLVCADEDDIFRRFFRVFVQRSGSVQSSPSIRCPTPGRSGDSFAR